MMSLYPEFYCLIAMMSLLLGLTLWNKFGAEIIQYLNAGKKR